MCVCVLLCVSPTLFENNRPIEPFCLPADKHGETHLGREQIITLPPLSDEWAQMSTFSLRLSPCSLISHENTRLLFRAEYSFIGDKRPQTTFILRSRSGEGDKRRAGAVTLWPCWPEWKEPWDGSRRWFSFVPSRREPELTLVSHLGHRLPLWIPLPLRQNTT